MKNSIYIILLSIIFISCKEKADKEINIRSLQIELDSLITELSRIEAKSMTPGFAIAIALQT